MSLPRLVASLLCGAALLCAGAALALLAPPAPTTEAVRVHPDAPEILTGPWLDRLDLFPDVDGLTRVRFGLAPWGAVLARLEIDTPEGRTRVLVRSLSGRTWRALQARAARVLGGPPPAGGLDAPLGPPSPRTPPDTTLAAPADTTAAPADTAAVARLDTTGTARPDRAAAAPDTAAAPDPTAGPAIRAWPETPPPPAAPPREEQLAAGAVPVRGRWLALLEAGARWDVSEYNAFFTPMGHVGLAFGHGITERLIAMLGFDAGFGDMRSDFEDAFGDGRSNTFGFHLSALARLPLFGRHDLYAQAGGGYHIRSLYWGGAFLDPVTGRLTEGRVLEQQDFGLLLRAGWLWHRDHPSKPRFLDVGLSLQTTPADRWAFWTEDVSFAASGRDLWLVLSVRFWDGL